MGFERKQLAPVSIAVTASAATSPIFNNRSGSALLIEKVSGDVATLALHAVLTIDGSGTYKPLQNTDGTPISITLSATDIVAVDLDAFGACWLRFVGNATGVILVGGKG